MLLDGNLVSIHEVPGRPWNQLMAGSVGSQGFASVTARTASGVVAPWAVAESGWLRGRRSGAAAVLRQAAAHRPTGHEGQACHGRDPVHGHLDLDNFRKVRAVAAVVLLRCDDAVPTRS